AAPDFCTNAHSHRRTSKLRCWWCQDRFQRSSWLHLSEHHDSLLLQAFRTHDDRLYHLVDKERVLGSEIPNVQWRRSHAGIEGITFNIHELEASSFEALLDPLLEVAQLADISAGLPSVEPIYDAREYARKLPAFNRDLKQGALP